ncbi:MAG: hypothetical protein ACNS60_12695 [Candidatus Cyclobacteriaceae bacterium M2_1C_046]
MTSRNIERHKNYYEIMRRHNKRLHAKRLTRTLIYILFVIGLAIIFYFAMDKLERVDNKNSGRNSTYVLPKLENNGNEKRSPEKCVPIEQFMV